MSQSLPAALALNPALAPTQIQRLANQDILTTTKPSDAVLEKIERSAQEFEALVLSQLLAPIFASVEQSALTGGGSKDEAFQSMIQEEYAKSIAARGGIGIADQVKASLLAIQANQTNI